MESDYQETQTIDTRVVMGQEALLKTTETQKGKPFVKPRDQAILLPETHTQAKQTRLETNEEKHQVQPFPKPRDLQKDPVQPPDNLTLPIHVSTKSNIIILYIEINW